MSLYESLTEKSEEEAKIILEKFVGILVRHRHLGKVEEIISSFENIWQKDHGELPVNMISARDLDNNSKTLVINYLKDKTGASQVLLQEEKDLSLIGGFILKYDNRVIDTSLKSQLESLKNKLKK